MRRSPGCAIGVVPSNGKPDACARRCRTVEPGGPAASSRSSTPSSAATSAASAVTSFVTDAHAYSRPSSPCHARIPSGSTTPAATLSTGQSSTCIRASTAGDTRLVRRQISSGSPYEPIWGYVRAVVDGRHVYVSGTAPIMPDGVELPEDAYGQAKRCLEIIGAALAEAGAGPEHVVRTRIYLTSADVWEEVARAHAEVF